MKWNKLTVTNIQDTFWTYWELSLDCAPPYTETVKAVVRSSVATINVVLCCFILVLEVPMHKKMFLMLPINVVVMIYKKSLRKYEIKQGDRN